MTAWIIIPDSLNNPIRINTAQVIYVRCEADGKATFYFASGGILRSNLLFNTIPWEG